MSGASAAPREAGRWEYEGGLVVVRLEDEHGRKTFKQWHRTAAGSLEPGAGGARRSLFRLDEIRAAPAEQLIFLVEGEKACDALRARGLVATTSSQGAKSWALTAAHAAEVLRGRHVVILPDHDDAGRGYAQAAAATLTPVAASLRVLDLPGLDDGEDVVEWLERGGDEEELVRLAEACPVVGAVAPRTPDALVDEILARASEPWVCLGLGGAEIARLRLGSWAAVMGGPGAGKSTLVAALLAEHARLHGPAIYLSLELGADELAARVIGMAVSASWEDVLRGRVPRADMLAALPARLAILDREADDTRVEQLGAVVATLRARHPGSPILAALDYIQLEAGDGPDVRSRVSATADAIRVAAKRLRIALIGVSQTSRAAAGALRRGELVGADTMSAGAESAGIERGAYATLAIGSPGEPGEDGARPVDLHLGKGRFGGGDRVLPMRYDGRSGRWTVVGESRAAADVIAERAGARDDKKTRGAMDAIQAAAERASAPCTRGELARAAGISETSARAAIARLLADGALAECARTARSHSARLWTPTRIAARGAELAAGDTRRAGERPEPPTADRQPTDSRPTADRSAVECTTDDSRPALSKGRLSCVVTTGGRSVHDNAAERVGCQLPQAPDQGDLPLREPSAPTGFATAHGFESSGSRAPAEPAREGNGTSARASAASASRRRETW